MSKFFKAAKSFTLKEIADFTDGKIIGNPELKIDSITALENATHQDISFFNNPAYLEQFTNTKAGACFISEKYIDKAPQSLSLIVVKDPYLAFATLSGKLYPLPEITEQMGNFVDIHESATIGKNCHISNFVSIGKNVV
ncbi:MAG: hypothetical protein LBH40_01610, partial [Alphaproteobacteria bacterium]|nr:hypothetical protein [Alphaproteobacteria bacterium]